VIELTAAAAADGGRFRRLCGGPDCDRVRPKQMYSRVEIKDTSPFTITPLVAAAAGRNIMCLSNINKT